MAPLYEGAESLLPEWGLPPVVILSHRRGICAWVGDGMGWPRSRNVLRTPALSWTLLQVKKWDASLLIYLGNVTYCYKKKYRMIWFKFSVNTTFSK